MSLGTKIKIAIVKALRLPMTIPAFILFDLLNIERLIHIKMKAMAAKITPISMMKVRREEPMAIEGFTCVKKLAMMVTAPLANAEKPRN